MPGQINLTLEEIKLVQTMLKEIDGLRSLEEKVIYLENFIKKIKNEELKKELQKIIRILQAKISEGSININRILMDKGSFHVEEEINIPRTEEIDMEELVLEPQTSSGGEEINPYMKTKYGNISYLSGEDKTKGYAPEPVYKKEEEKGEGFYITSEGKKEEEQPQPYMAKTSKKKDAFSEDWWE